MVANYMKIVEQLELERMKELDLRTNARHAEWDVVNKERDAEHDERLQTKQGRRRRLLLRAPENLAGRKAEGRSSSARPRRTEIKQIKKQERADEDKLGQDFPLDDPGVKK